MNEDTITGLLFLIVIGLPILIPLAGFVMTMMFAMAVRFNESLHDHSMLSYGATVLTLYLPLQLMGYGHGGLLVFVAAIPALFIPIVPTPVGWTTYRDCICPGSRCTCGGKYAASNSERRRRQQQAHPESSHEENEPRTEIIEPLRIGHKTTINSTPEQTSEKESSRNVNATAQNSRNEKTGQKAGSTDSRREFFVNKFRS